MSFSSQEDIFDDTFYKFFGMHIPNPAPIEIYSLQNEGNNPYDALQQSCLHSSTTNLDQTPVNDLLDNISREAEPSDIEINNSSSSPSSVRGRSYDSFCGIPSYDSPITKPSSFYNDLQLRADTTSPLTLLKAKKYLVVLVGLPASGKSSVAKHLIDYLDQNNVLGQPIRSGIYNAGDVRRSSVIITNGPIIIPNGSVEDDIFNPRNAKKKEEFARVALDSLLHDMANDVIDLAIFDATNSTIERRNYIWNVLRTFNNESNIMVTPLVLEVSCDKSEYIKYNVHNKAFNKDYCGNPYSSSILDFAKRLLYYKKQFTPFNEIEYPLLSSASNGNIFHFRISNAGISSVGNMIMFNKDIFDLETNLLIREIEKFSSNYHRYYGYCYTDRVENFFDNCTSNKQTPSVKAENIQRDYYRKVLSEIFNSSFLETLRMTNVELSCGGSGEQAIHIANNSI